MYYEAKCIGCLACVQACPTNSLRLASDGTIEFEEETCSRCGRCAQVCPSGAMVMSGQRMSVKRVIEIVDQDRAFYEESGGGVTISGGEPLDQPDFTIALLRACREIGLHVALDTSGFAPAQTFDAAAAVADLILFDVKAIDDRRHRRMTGGSNRSILANLRRLTTATDGPAIILRRPLIPGYNDDDAELSAFIDLVSEIGRPPVEILPYHSLASAKYQALRRPLPSETATIAQDKAGEAAERWRQQLEVAGIRCTILHGQKTSTNSYAKAT